MFDISPISRRPRRRRATAGLMTVMAVLVAACAGAVRPADVQLSVGDSFAGEVEHRAVVASVARDTVTVQGVISAPTPCFALRAGQTAATNELEVRIAAHPEQRPDGACAQVITQFPYTATVPLEGTGMLRVRVLHEYRDVQWEPANVLDTAVFVP
jgi:hypothetical protein